LVSLTITEAGYRRGADGGLDRSDPQVQHDLAMLRADPTGAAGTAPGRLLAGLAARHAADAGPLAIVPCDNLPDNGAVIARVLDELAEAANPSLARWMADSVSYVTTMVDRITPRTTEQDAGLVAAETGYRDRAPVVTEPFSEWVLSGAFPGGRPGWQDAGAVFTADITPHEQRKLWLLNGGHSLLAYAGSIGGHRTVAEAVSDQRCRAWVEQWWLDAAAQLSLPAEDVSRYCRDLLQRWRNPRIEHLLAQIAADGSLKLPVRLLPVLRAERAAGRLPLGAARVLAAWICHLRGAGAPITDVQADVLAGLVTGSADSAVTRIVSFLDPELAEDQELRATVLTLMDEVMQGWQR
jgi:fructuronate reductase